MGDGRVRHVHANKMRKFHIHVQGCNVISEADSDFGRVIAPVNVSENVLPSINVDCDKLCHLYHTQQQDSAGPFVISLFLFVKIDLATDSGSEYDQDKKKNRVPFFLTCVTVVF